MKMKLKGRSFETMSDIQRESQEVLDSIKENYFHSAFDASKLSQYFFFDLVQELSNSILYTRRWLKIWT
jgi:hypothetical protein